MLTVARFRRWGPAALVLTLIGAQPGLAPAQSPSGTIVTELVSVADDGTPGDDNSFNYLFHWRNQLIGADRLVSADGRYVVFASAASNLGNDQNEHIDLFMRDRTLESTFQINTDPQGQPAFSLVKGAGYNPSISNDGHRIAFTSQAYGLDTAPADETCDWGGFGPHPDIYVKMWDTVPSVGPVIPVTPNRVIEYQRNGQTIRECSGGGVHGTLSGDGSKVAFSSYWDWVNNRVPTDGALHVYSLDLGSGTYSRVDEGATGVGSGATFGDSGSELPRMNSDGTKTVFVSKLSGMANVPQTGTDYYAYLNDGGQISVASVDKNLQPRTAVFATISDQGNHVAFASIEDGIVPEDTNGKFDIFVRDLRTNKVERISDVENDALRPYDAAFGPSLSADGTQVAFWTNSTVQGGVRPWLRDRRTNSTIVIQREPGPADLGNDSERRSGGFPSISYFGDFISFISRTTRFEGDTERFNQAWLWNRVPDVRLIGLEVTQGIQNLLNEATLVEGRATFVRAHVRSLGDNSVKKIRAELIVSRGATRLGAATPVNPGGVAEAPPKNHVWRVARPNREPPITVDGDLRFRIPQAWATGTITLKLKSLSHPIQCGEPGLNPEDCEVTVSFEAPQNLLLQFVPITWTDAKGPHAPRPADYGAAYMQVFRMYPVPFIFAGVSPTTIALPAAPKTEPEWQDLADRIAAINAAGCPSPCRRYSFGLMVDQPPAQYSEITGYSNDIPGTGAAGYLHDVKINVSHELAHLTGLEHPKACSPTSDSVAYPFADGRLGESNSGIDAYYGFDVSANRVIGPPRNYFDLMCYLDDLWTSSFSWEHIFDTLEQRNAFLVRRTPFGTKQAPPDAPTALIAGHLTKSGAATVDSMYVFPDAIGNPPQGGDLALHVLDDQGGNIAAHPLDLARGPDGTGRSFLATIPWPVGAERISIRDGSAEIGSIGASPSPPTVSNIAASFEGQAVVSWTAGDLDGDDLTFTVQLSTDGGSEWETLAFDHPGTSLEIDPAFLPGTANGKIRVLASDGFNTSIAESTSPIVIPANAPSVFITSPQEGAAFSEDQTVFVDGLAFDPEDGALEEGAFKWVSDRDGEIGAGRTLEILANELSPGAHAITVTATDSDGMTASDAITIWVFAMADDVPACAGIPAGIVGSSGSEELAGTEGPDAIGGLGGNDVVSGGGSDDTICGGGGSDKLIGGPGRDVLIGGPGRDNCIGGSGRDRFKGCERKKR